MLIWILVERDSRNITPFLSTNSQVQNAPFNFGNPQRVSFISLQHYSRVRQVVDAARLAYWSQFGGYGAQFLDSRRPSMFEAFLHR